MKKTLSIMIAFAIMLTSLFITACTPEDKSGKQSTPANKNEFDNEEKATPGLHYVVLDDGTYGVGISEETKTLTDIVVPATYGDKPVTQVLDSGFAGATEIKTVKLPDTITAIGSNAFSECTSLESINIPDGVTIIKTGAFWQCNSLKNIVLPDSVLYLQGRAFSHSGLESITLSKSLTVISPEAFYSCWKLKSIKIPESVTKIYDKAFGSCDSRTEVYIPLSLTRVEINSFDSCYSLETMYYPGSAEEFAKIENARFLKGASRLHCNYTPENNE